MTDLAVDYYGIARSMLLRAIRARAKTGDDSAVVDIQAALEDLDGVVARGDWDAMIRTACWLTTRAERGNA